MRKKITILLIILIVCLIFAGPVVAKQKVKIKISTDEHPFPNKGYIVIKLVDSHGHAIRTKGTIHYNITDSKGNYHWVYKPYNGEVRIKEDLGKYKVSVKFDGDSHFKKAKKVKKVKVKKSNFNAYNYYDNHFWGLNQEIDDYIEYNYWDDEIYDDPLTYDGEGY